MVIENQLIVYHIVKIENFFFQLSENLQLKTSDDRTDLGWYIKVVQVQDCQAHRCGFDSSI